MILKKKRKITFGKATEYNGIIYKKGFINFSENLLEQIGITEDNPNVVVIQDTVHNCLIIKAE